MHIILKN
jgi:hypothetical protein